MAAIAGPSWLMEMRCQFSYPLNSEKARPLGTLSAYLPVSGDLAGFAQASTSINSTIAGMLLFVIRSPPVEVVATRLASSVAPPLRLSDPPSLCPSDRHRFLCPHADGRLEEGE